MSTMLKDLTYYFRDAVVAQKMQQIKITTAAVTTSCHAVALGKLSPDACAHLFQPKKRDNNDEQEIGTEADTDYKDQTIEVIIAAQVVNCKVDGGARHATELGDLTGTFFLPALLSETGTLTPTPDGIPWMTRKFLSPVIDDVLIVGDISSCDAFVGSQTKALFDIQETGSWEKYFALAKAFWKSVNHTELGGEFIYNYVCGEHPLVLDEFWYVIPDPPVSATHNIKKLYEYALTEDKAFNTLYKTILSMYPHEDRPLIDNTLSQMENHSGQMSGNYPLSPSQRESINHFFATKQGDVLAINGPPGTGKTTLLQSIVADMVVKRALSKEDAPIIVATSTNNQAVTNIIESFASADSRRHTKGLDTHWIHKKKSFSTFFPSKKKMEAALKQGYQVTSAAMDASVAEWEDAKNKDESRKSFIENCRRLFGRELTLKQCGEYLYNLLVSFDQSRREMLRLSEQLPFEILISTHGMSQNIQMLDEAIAECVEREAAYKSRLQAWNKLWNKLFLYRMLGVIPYVKQRLRIKLANFLTLDEHDLAHTLSSYSDVEAFYSNLLQDNMIRHQGYRTAKELLKHASVFESKDINIFASSKDTISLTSEALNALFDVNIRFFEFWVSVHYFEYRWLSDKRKMDEQELFKSTIDAMTNKYKRLCMLTPCLVMTFYMLPAHFTQYKGKYLYDFIDLLIVDEAGQVSPEIGASAFLLAKKALVVGDMYQIEPVWNVPRELDMALAIGRNIVTANTFSVLETNGLNTSESNLMKIACNACAFSKFEKKGLMLTEHRRCYNEIIGFCNDLVYDGKLQPLRGGASEDIHNPFPNERPVQHIQVKTAKSERSATSRYNPAESDAILAWLVKNYAAIKSVYREDRESSLIGIITPFKAQAEYVQNKLQHLSENIAANVAVGTVHTFQGGERRIILFSTVYGADDGCAFLDFKKNLMNVAMSRAKDRFIVFGDLGCLNSSNTTPSGLLRKYLS